MPRYSILWRSYDYITNWKDIDYNEFCIQEMQKTWQFIQEYKFWFLAYPKAKHNFTIEHMILREKNTTKSEKKYEELYELIEKFSKDDYVCWRNCISRQSIPWIVHYHIAKFKDMDKEIDQLI